MLSGGGGEQSTYRAVRSYLDQPNAPLTQSFTATASVRGGLGTRASLGSPYTITYPAEIFAGASGTPTVTLRQLARTDDFPAPLTPRRNTGAFTPVRSRKEFCKTRNTRSQQCEVRSIVTRQLNM